MSGLGLLPCFYILLDDFCINSSCFLLKIIVEKIELLIILMIKVKYDLIFLKHFNPMVDIVLAP